MKFGKWINVLTKEIVVYFGYWKGQSSIPAQKNEASVAFPTEPKSISIEVEIRFEDDDPSGSNSPYHGDPKRLRIAIRYSTYQYVDRGLSSDLCDYGLESFTCIDITSSTVEDLVSLFEMVVNKIGAQNVVHTIAKNNDRYNDFMKQLLVRVCTCHPFNRPPFEVVENENYPFPSPLWIILNNFKRGSVKRVTRAHSDINESHKMSLRASYASGLLQSKQFTHSIVWTMVLSTEDIRDETKLSLYKCMKRLILDDAVINEVLKEINMYDNAVWCSLFGMGCKHLQRLATRILSQPSSLFFCNSNEFCGQKLKDGMNRLEDERLNEMMRVQLHLKLKTREFPDPVSYEHITSVVEEWVREEISSNEASMCDWSKVVLPTLSFEKKLEDASEALGGVFDDIEVFKGLEDRGF
ncbi:hypothetical protein E3N88_34086 [Mikania micrantha]|uniref:Uncharacterized protein n=1 Tax=Mikania micrantha TaxID=192012 RepID=A0A5N6MD23_9ASTR|nr:hypothetical protein E3N88_34086 [Mikania micrantha]